MFPVEVLIASLRELAVLFPLLPVTVYTEALGGAEQRLREGSARIALYPPIPQLAPNRDAEFLVTIPTVPVVAASHHLAAAKPPLSRGLLENEVQLVLTDRALPATSPTIGVISRRTWRFADLETRRAFLLAGFGWCNMPLPLVREDIAAGRLKILRISEHTAPAAG
jgi:DNA-binding transcriptional LysR family regulator